MSDFEDYVEGAAARLVAGRNAGYGPLPLPAPLDAEIGRLLDAFTRASPEQREFLLSRMTREHSPTLLAFSERMASLAVRERAPGRILEGLLALVVEGYATDYRENALILSLHHDAATRIGADPARLFEEAASYAKPEVAQALTKFLARSPEDKSIAAMGYEVGAEPDGFRYHRTW